MGVSAAAGSHHRSPTCRVSKHQEPTSWPSSLMHGVGVRGSENGEREAHCLRQCGWPASSLLILGAQIDPHGSCACAESDKALATNTNS